MKRLAAINFCIFGLICFTFFYWVSCEEDYKKNETAYQAERESILQKGRDDFKQKEMFENKDLAWKYVINKMEGVVVYDGIFNEYKTTSIYPKIDYSESTFVVDRNYTNTIKEAYIADKEKELRYTRKVVIKEKGGYGEPRNLRYIPPEIMITNIQIYVDAMKFAEYNDGLKYVPMEVRINFPEVCLEAVKKYPENICHVPQETILKCPEIGVIAVKKYYKNFKYVPFEIRKQVFDQIYGVEKTGF